MERSDYIPLIARCIRTFLATTDPAPSAMHRKLLMGEAQQALREIEDATIDARRKVEKGNDYFTRHGGWGAADPDPKPPSWDRNTRLFLKHLHDYEVLIAARKIGTAIVWTGDAP